MRFCCETMVRELVPSLSQRPRPSPSTRAPPGAPLPIVWKWTSTSAHNSHLHPFTVQRATSLESQEGCKPAGTPDIAISRKAVRALQNSSAAVVLERQTWSLATARNSFRCFWATVGPKLLRGGCARTGGKGLEAEAHGRHGLGHGGVHVRLDVFTSAPCKRSASFPQRPI